MAEDCKRAGGAEGGEGGAVIAPRRLSFRLFSLLERGKENKSGHLVCSFWNISGGGFDGTTAPSAHRHPEIPQGTDGLPRVFVHLDQSVFLATG